MLITSLENDRIKNYIKLKDKKYRDKTGTYLVDGMHLVLEAYKSGYLEEVILEADEVFPIDIPIVYVTNEIIHKITGVETPTKIMGLCKKKNDELVGDKILLLDGVQDPGNLGTIIRSSAAFDVSTIVLGAGCADLYNQKTIRSTQGMMYHVNIVNKDIEEVIALLKSKQIKIYGTRVEYGTNVNELKNSKKNKYALIMGNEGNGVREEILDMCDDYLYIPMNEKVESLNVAVATSIILYELNRR